MNLERLGSITSELSTSLLKSIVVPQGGLRAWFARHRSANPRNKNGRPEGRPERDLDVSTAEFPAGPVILMGGMPVPDEAVVAAVHLGGGRSARVAVVPAAAGGSTEEAAAAAARAFTRFGMKHVEPLLLDSREKAADPEWVARLREYEAIVLCGDSPARGLHVLQATAAATALREHVQAGRLLVGIDAGGAILGSRLFPHEADDGITVGLGLLPALLIDAGFSGARRFSRLVRAMSAPEAAAMMGIGLDTRTAVLVSDGEAKVLGEATVTVLDPWERGTPSDDRPGGLKVHLLTDGYRLSFRTRRAFPPERPEAEGK